MGLNGMLIYSVSKHEGALLRCINFIHNQTNMVQSFKHLEDLEELQPASNEK